MPKLRGATIDARIFTRQRGGAQPRLYADFRDFSDQGGGQEALRPRGARYATTDPEEGRQLAEARLKELVEKEAHVPNGGAMGRALSSVIHHHLRMKAASLEGTPQWLGNVEVHLTAAADYFGDDLDLSTLQPADVEEYAVWLNEQPNGRGGTLGSGSVIQYLNSLSNLYRRAISMGLVGMGKNPVANMHRKPKVVRVKTPWLEVPELSGILRFAFEEFKPRREDLAFPLFPQVLATLALTGGRETEIYGLRTVDVNFERGIIRIEPNEWRRLKNDRSERPVRLFSQLAEILHAHLTGPHAPQGDLLFPSYGLGARPRGREHY